MRILYIGGTGEISFDCIHESVRAGHDVSVFNRGNRNEGLPGEVTHIAGDMRDDAAYGALAEQNFDVVCQFRLFTVPQMQRDIDLFTGHCGQYVFISSASAYRKPLPHHVVTEHVPVENRYWTYSQNKADCERLLQGQSKLPFTVVRPSHTYRTSFPTSGIGDVAAQRMLTGKPVIVHGDGTSLWTITHASDFAPPFVKLLGNKAALGEHYHLTSDLVYSWNQIYESIAQALRVEAVIVHVPTDTLVRYKPEWAGPLLGDKTGSTIFDNAKIKSVVGDFACKVGLDEGMRRVAADHRPQDKPVNADIDALWDRIIADQSALGSPLA